MLVGKDYVPILKVKVSELEAFRQLSPSCKDVTFPIFLLLPWPNANFLQLSIDKILDATGGRNFGLGLDDGRLGVSSKKSAQDEFDKLFDPTLGYKAYYDFVAAVQGAVPVLRPSRDLRNVIQQLDHAKALDKGVIVHQRRGAEPHLMNEIIGSSALSSDVLFVVDAAWSRDALQMHSWASGIVRTISGSRPDAEIAVVSSSFPDTFAHIVGDSEEAAHETHVFNVIRTTFQSVDLTYGDWGSTRLPQSGGGGDIPSRIDIPRPNSWQIFRANPKADLGFLPIATQAMAHPSYAQMPDCWGKMQIAATDGKKLGITGTKMNTSARINMHMTINAGTASPMDFYEEPYED